MESFDSFEKKQKTGEAKKNSNNCERLNQESALELWEHGQGIRISRQSVSGQGIHIFEEARYFQQNRSVVIYKSSTKSLPEYEQIFIPENITTANGLIDYIKCHGGFGCFSFGYKPSEELTDKLNCIL